MAWRQPAVEQLSAVQPLPSSHPSRSAPLPPHESVQCRLPLGQALAALALGWCDQTLFAHPSTVQPLPSSQLCNMPPTLPHESTKCTWPFMHVVDVFGTGL